MAADTSFCTAHGVYHNEWLLDPARRAHHWRDHHTAIKRAIAEMWIHDRAATTSVVDTETIEEHFGRLADEWSRDTGHISSVTDLIKDPSYQQIIDMGQPVLPYLLRDLDRNKRFWFPALAAVTGLRPFDSKDQGNYRLMTEAWLRWGRLKGLI